MVSVGVNTNHVRERRNFCFAEIRRPDPPHVFVHLHDFMVNSNLVTSSGLSHFCELANRNFAKPLQA